MTPDLLERFDWDNPNFRVQFLRDWVKCPRQPRELESRRPPRGFRPCPVPSVARHLLQPGHRYTSDGLCWVPDER